MIAIILSAVFFLAAGWCRAIFECVTIMNTMRYHWTRQIVVDGKTFDYWGYSLFVYQKDRNGDGKTSYWEKTWVRDGGHASKRLELLFYALGATTLLYAPHFGLLDVLYVPFIWLLISGSFDYWFDIYRKKP